MPEIAWILLAAALALLIAATGGVLGGSLVWRLTCRSLERSGSEPASVYDGYDPDGPGEETVKVRSSDPDVVEVAAELDAEPEPERAVARRSMSAMSVDERLESKTVRITIGPEQAVRPWWYGGRHSTRESRCRVPSFLAAPQATAEFPEVGRHRSGEHELLDGVSG